jgi:hypothetical protein
MSALKTAAKSLIDQMQTAAKTNGDVYISIVPFAKDVNVGSIADTNTSGCVGISASAPGPMAGGVRLRSAS